jgi:hypothetical protein
MRSRESIIACRAEEARRSPLKPAAVFMSSSPTRDSRRPDATAQPGVKNVFHRDPLLVPQRREDRPKPWFRRRAVWALVSLGVAVAVVIVVELGASIARALAGVIGR